MSTTVTKRISGAASGGQTARVSETPVGNETKRVSSAPSGGQTSRVTGAASGTFSTVRVGHLLEFEGDESGFLLLEGDMQDIGDALQLEGDAAAISSTLTKRVA